MKTTPDNEKVWEFVIKLLMTQQKKHTHGGRPQIAESFQRTINAMSALIYDPMEETHIGRFLEKYLPTFQAQNHQWMLQCFGLEIACDAVERNHRFLEESLELVQSKGCTREEALMLVDYVYNRPVGEPFQEVGGVMVTLAALCSAADIKMDKAAEAELDRINDPEIMEKIRVKQATKPRNSPLPQVEAKHYFLTGNWPKAEDIRAPLESNCPNLQVVAKSEWPIPWNKDHIWGDQLPQVQALAQKFKTLRPQEVYQNQWPMFTGAELLADWAEEKGKARDFDRTYKAEWPLLTEVPKRDVPEGMIVVAIQSPTEVLVKFDQHSYRDKFHTTEEITQLVSEDLLQSKVDAHVQNILLEKANTFINNLVVELQKDPEFNWYFHYQPHIEALRRVLLKELLK